MNFTNQVQIVKILLAKCFLFSGYSTQFVTIHENFALVKLGKLILQKFFPSKITSYTVVDCHVWTY